jgi:hypothetical protein
MFTCVAAAAAFGMFGTASHATFYGGDFDPPTIQGHFTGHFLLNVTGNCNHPNGEGSDCRIDLVNLLIDGSGTFGPGWISLGQSDIATNIIFDGHLFAFDSTLINLFIPGVGGLTSDAGLGSFDVIAAAPCTPQLRFTSNFATDFGGHTGFIADMECNNANGQSIGDNAIYVLTQIPEPGTLALILGGIGAGWLTRRRKAAA